MLHLRPQRNPRHCEGKAPRPNHNTLPPKQSPGRGAPLLATLISLILCPLSLGSPHAQSATWTTLATTSGTLVPGSLCTTDGKDLTCNQPLSGLMSPDRITSGTAGVFVSDTGIISFRTGNVTTGYFDTAGLLVTPGISVTTANGISSTNGYFGGNVGIGIKNPGSMLDVAGNISASGILFVGKQGNSGRIQLRRSSDGSAQSWVGYNDVNSNTEVTIFGGGGSTFLSFYTNATERMRITNSGYIGVATQTPTTALEVSGTVSATRFVGDGSGLTNIAGASADRIVSGTTSMLAISNTGYISVTQSGLNTAYFHPSLGLVTVGVSTTGGISGTTGYFSSRIGIGTTDPSSSIDSYASVNGTVYARFANASTGTGARTRLTLSTTSSTYAFINLNGTNYPTDPLALSIASPFTGEYPIIFFTGGQERMRLRSGFVGLGTSTPTTALEVSGTVSATDVRFSGNATLPTGKCASATDEGRMVMTANGPYVCLLR